MAVLLDKFQTVVGAGTYTAHAVNGVINPGTLPSGVTANGGNVQGSVSGWMGLSFMPSAAVFELNTTAATSLVGDTLDVYLQYSIDGGQIWQDFGHFAQLLGNGGVQTTYLQYAALQVTPGTTVAHSDGALAAGTIVKGPIGSPWRVKLVQAGASAQFTVAVYVGGTTGK